MTPSRTKKLLAIVLGEHALERSLEQLEAEQYDHTQLGMIKKMTLVDFSAGFEKSLGEESESSRYHQAFPLGARAAVPRLVSGSAIVAARIPIRKIVRKLLRLPDEEDNIWIGRSNTAWEVSALECSELA